MLRSARGQTTVELVALLPVLAVLAAGVWQAAVAGHAWWSAGAAARAASRTAAIGGDTRSAALRVVPVRLRDAARVVERPDGRVTVRVPIRAVAGGARLATASATARFEPQR
jgi:Flp pilus assembly protein TadG